MTYASLSDPAIEVSDATPPVALRLVNMAWLVDWFSPDEHRRCVAWP